MPNAIHAAVTHWLKEHYAENEKVEKTIYKATYRNHSILGDRIVSEGEWKIDNAGTAKRHGELADAYSEKARRFDETVGMLVETRVRDEGDRSPQADLPDTAIGTALSVVRDVVEMPVYAVISGAHRVSERYHESKAKKEGPVIHDDSSEKYERVGSAKGPWYARAVGVDSARYVNLGRTEEKLGASGGYTSLNEAIEAAKDLTRGADKPACLVAQKGEKLYLYGLVEQVHNSDDTKPHHSENNDSLDYTFGGTHDLFDPAWKAIVDGDRVIERNASNTKFYVSTASGGDLGTDALGANPFAGLQIRLGGGLHT